MVIVEERIDTLRIDQGWVYLTWDDGREFAISVETWRELGSPVDDDVIVLELSMKEIIV